MPKTQNQHSCPYCNAHPDANGKIIHHQSIYCYMNMPSEKETSIDITNQLKDQDNQNTDDITNDNIKTKKF
ncbi:MAG: hypothetical protein WCO13_14865 [Bacteroidota bacterium]